MNQSNHQVVNNLPLDQLIAHALGELKKLHYSRRTLRRYRTIWQNFMAFSRQMNLNDKYSDDLAASFADAYRIPNGERLKAKEEWRRHLVFGVKVLGDFVRDGRIERTVVDMQRLQVPAAMKKPLCDYEQYCRERRHLRLSTLRERIREIGIFMDFLGSRNVATLDQMQPADLTAFVTSWHRLKPKTVSRIVSDVRGFLQFLLLRGILCRDLSQVLPHIHVTRDAAVPSVWEPELLVKLLKVVDRSSPKGKRDLLARMSPRIAIGGYPNAQTR
jgi:hypothetical protein